MKKNSVTSGCVRFATLKFRKIKGQEISKANFLETPLPPQNKQNF